MTDHFREAEQILAELHRFQAGLSRSSDMDPDEYEEAINLLTVNVGQAQVHATLALAAKQNQPPPGSCTIRGPRDSYTVTMDGREHVYERAGNCKFLDGQAGDCANTSDHRWNANTPKAAAAQVLPAEQDGPEF